MSVPALSTRAGILLTVAAAVAYAIYVTDDQWRRVLSERFVYGVPWGTLVTVGGVVSFYLFAQSGFSHWADPVVVAFRSWSYFYPVGMLTAGFAHGGPGHLVSNMAGTLVLGPIAEYVWGHYPPGRLADNRTRDLTQFAGSGGPFGLLVRPWARALVVFPAVIVVVSLVTSVFAFGWSLGFSGTVFAIGGFALVRYPLSTIVSMLVITGVNVLVSSLLEPVLRATSEQGPPAPPAWAVVNVQAHMLGFLVGILLGVALLWRRRVRPDSGRLFVGVVLFVLARELWAFALPAGEDVFLQFRGVGLIFVLLLAVLVTATVTASDRRIPSLLGRFGTVPSRRQFAAAWLIFLAGAVSAFVVTDVFTDGSATAGVETVLLLAVILALPGLLVVLPESARLDPITRRHVAVVVLAVLTVVIALPSAVSNVPAVEESAPGNPVAVGDYQVTYVDNATDGRRSGVRQLPYDDWGTSSGVVVVSEQRHVWSTAVQPSALAHDGSSTVVVGGLGWRETVAVERDGWDVVDGGAAYVVDLTVDNETTRSFVSTRAESDTLVEGHTVAVVPTQDAFQLNVTHNGQQVGEIAMPDTNETATVGDVRFISENRSLYVESDDTRVLFAEKDSGA